MRTLGYRTHVLLAVAAAVGVIASLSEPWYAQAPRVQADAASVGSLHGPVEGFSAGISRWLTETSGVNGWTGLGSWGTALAACAALAAVGALACLVPALQGVAREALRYGGLAMFGLAVWKLIDTPGPNATMEPRFGAFVATIAALVVVTSGGAVANAPLQRRAPSVWASS